MEGISDPETFQLSETVEKSSKSGIFTNKRLLMIKDGFLYYFSNVPADYKAHEPNLMSTLKEFPKCSIEIRSIQTIKLESAKSSTLIITFYDRDMIDREDIRKSLSSKNYNHPVKPNRDDLEEWKFIFATVMKCRLWYGSLVKLKQYFVKNQDKFDKFTEYMANFDPQIRSSLPQRASAPTALSPSSITNNLHPTPPRSNNSPESKYKLEKESGIFEIQESNEEYDEEITPKNKINKFEAKERKPSIEIEVIKNETIKEERLSNKADEVEKKEQQPPKIIFSQPIPKKEETEAREQKQIEKQPDIKPVEQVISEEVIVHLPPSDQSISSKEVSIAEDIRLEEARKADEQVALFNQQLQHKEEMIRKMTEQIENNRRAKQMLEERVREEQEKREEEEKLRLRLEREKREEEAYKRLRESIKSQPPLTERGSREVLVREESMQTEEERELMEVIEGRQPSKLSRYSFKSDFSINPLTNQRQTLNLFRNTISYISEVKIETHEVENYDYFWQIGQIYRGSDLKDRIARELQLAEFVGKASKKASDLIINYIDYNRPRESLRIDRNMFQIEIVCDRGRVIRTEGSERLVYPNENHQRLKRTFKIYNYLNEVILNILKKKPSYPLRVPFACLVQYKGYTALARIIPPLKDNSVNAQSLKMLGQTIPLYNLTLNDFECHTAVYSIVQPTIYFKPTKEDQISIFRFPEKSNDFLSSNRRANISITSKKLFEQAKEAEGNSKERLEVAEVLTFCRELKRIMKANTPYTDDSNNQFEFFDDFLKNPSGFMEGSIVSNEQQITGMLLYYIERLLGIKLKKKFANGENSYFAVPVRRRFTLSALDVSTFATNFQRYLCQKKYDLAEKSLSYSKQLEEDYSETLIREANLHISQGRCQEALERLELAEQMLSLHDPRRLKTLELQAQCLEAVGEVAASLACLKKLLEETQYTFGNRGKSRLVEVYFLIADMLSRQSHIPQVIQVYRRILHQNPDCRQKVLLDFARNLLRQDTDPHVLLDFLQKQLPESIQQDNPQVQHLLGQLYFRAKNRPKALGYLTAALSGMLAEGKLLDKIYEVFKRGIECCGSTREKKSYHRQIIGKITAAGLTDSKECNKINTYLCCLMGEGFSDGERDNIIIFLEYQKGSGEARLLEWGWLESILKKIGKAQRTTTEEKNVLIGCIDKNVFSESLILLNSPSLL